MVRFLNARDCLYGEGGLDDKMKDKLVRSLNNLRRVNGGGASV